MNEKNLELNVSGGNVNIGNVSQGDSSRVHSTQMITITQSDLDKFYSEIESLRKKRDIDSEEVDSLRKEVDRLMRERDLFLPSIKSLYEKYSWAIEPLKRLLALAL